MKKLLLVTMFGAVLSLAAFPVAALADVPAIWGQPTPGNFANLEDCISYAQPIADKYNINLTCTASDTGYWVHPT